MNYLFKKENISYENNFIFNKNIKYFFKKLAKADTGRLERKEEKALINQRKAQLSMVPAVRTPVQGGEPLRDAGTVAANCHKMSLFLRQFKKIALLSVQRKWSYFFPGLEIYRSGVSGLSWLLRSDVCAFVGELFIFPSSVISLLCIFDILTLTCYQEVIVRMIVFIVVNAAGAQVSISFPQIGQFWVVCKWSPVDPKTLQATSNAVGYTPELDCKTLLLKTLCTLVIEQGKIKPVLTWKLQSHRLAFMVLEGAMHTTQGEK